MSKQHKKSFLKRHKKNFLKKIEENDQVKILDDLGLNDNTTRSLSI